MGFEPSVFLELHASGNATINGQPVQQHLLVETLRTIYSYRIEKTLFIRPDPEVFVGGIVEILDVLEERPFLEKIALLTPRQVKDYEDESCIMRHPA